MRVLVRGTYEREIEIPASMEEDIKQKIRDNVEIDDNVIDDCLLDRTARVDLDYSAQSSIIQSVLDYATEEIDNDYVDELEIVEVR